VILGKSDPIAIPDASFEDSQNRSDQDQGTVRQDSCRYSALIVVWWRSLEPLIVISLYRVWKIIHKTITVRHFRVDWMH